MKRQAKCTEKVSENEKTKQSEKTEKGWVNGNGETDKMRESERER